MNFFDDSILTFVNHFSHKSVVFDQVVVFLENTNLLKGAGFLAFFWGCWLQPVPDLTRRRKIILSTLVGCAVAILAARLLALNLPFRGRPLNDDSIHFLHPFGTSQHTLETWSSFPSDHAALFFGLATGCFMLNRRVGILAATYAFVCVMLPRVYLGFHYPTDILAGGMIGVAAVSLAHAGWVREKVAGLGMVWMEKHPLSFYACLFLATYQFVVLFEDIRAGGHFAAHLYHYLRAGTPFPEAG